MSWVWRGVRPEPGAPPGPGRAPAGAFTTAGCEGGRPFLWALHAARLAHDIRTLDPRASVHLPGETELARLLLERDLVGPARLRVIVWRNTGGWRVGAEARPLPACGPTLPPLALEPVRREHAPPLAGHKVLARLSWDLAAARARRAGGDDALLVDAGGRVLETSIANVWAIVDGTAVTPPAPERCLPGVMRRWLLERLPAAGLEPEERDLTLAELLAAGEVWVSNALVGIRRVRRLGRHTWDRWPAFERLAGLGVPAPGWPR